MTDVLNAQVEPQVTTGPIPYSEKTYREVEGPGGITMKVPFRRINLTTGEHFDVYDTSGPYTDSHADIDLHRGLPPRPGVGTDRGTQLQRAQAGEITAEMAFIAAREGVSAELVRDEVALPILQQAADLEAFVEPAGAESAVLRYVTR